MYFTRSIEQTIRELCKNFACITVYGARQGGKDIFTGGMPGLCSSKMSREIFFKKK